MSRNPPPFPSTPARSQRGSVLIFVIGVLLLLAIIATAFLGSSRSDRVATQQNAYNTQTDLMLEGVINVMKGTILADARFNKDANGQDSFTEDTFLGSRVPVPFDPAKTTITGIDNPVEQPVWPFITAPQLDATFSFPMPPDKLLADNSPKYTTLPPSTYKGRRNLIPTSIKYNDGTQEMTLPAFVLNINDELGTYPTDQYRNSLSQVPVPAIDADGDGIADSGMVRLPTIAGVTYYYGARVIDANSAINVSIANAWNEGANANAFVGATAGSLPGNFFPTNIDLYHALSGIDAANRDYQLNRATNTDPKLYAGLNGLRLGQSLPTDSKLIASNEPHDDRPGDTPTLNARGDYFFSNDGELLWMQLGRRLQNPGNIYATTTGDNRTAKPLDVNAAASLARNFILADSTSEPTLLERTLPVSLLPFEKRRYLETPPASLAPSAVVVNDKPFKPEDALAWFNSTFAYNPDPAQPQLMPLRALLTSNSPTSPTVPETVSKDEVAYNARKPYQFGDTVGYLGRRFLCISPTVLGVAPDTLPGLRHWSLLGWTLNERKISLNTADFGEMWYGFRRVMGLGGGVRPFGQYVAGAPFPSFGGTVGIPASAALERAKWRQYRNVIRDPRSLQPSVVADRHNATTGIGSPAAAGARFMSNSEVLQLRSALAAVNTMDLRDTDDYVTARRITTAYFPPDAVSQPVPRHAVTVFGSERQPYITEVYVNTNSDAPVLPAGAPPVAGPNPRGYVAIELYNPDPVNSINLNGWSLGVIDRSAGTPRATPYAPLFFQRILPAAFDANNGRFGATVTIQPNGYLVLENYRPNAADPNAATANDALYRPPLAGTPANVKYVPNLQQVLYEAAFSGAPGTANGGELVLLRPRKANLTTGVFLPTRNLTPANGLPTDDPIDPCDEGDALVEPNLHDLVPVDSFDFTNMDQTVAGSPFVRVYHYVRETLATAPWKWTFGRTYRVTALPQSLPRQGGGVIEYAPAVVEPAAAFGIGYGLGVTDALGTPMPSPPAGAIVPDPTSARTGMAVSCLDWPSPRANGGGRQLFGTGGFLRDTDVFKVPAVGAYKVLTLLSVNTPSLVSADGLPLPDQPAPDNAAAIPALEPNFTEMNALPMDASLADDEEDLDINNIAAEQVGRLCPLSSIDPITWANYPAVKPGDVGKYDGGQSIPDYYDPNYNFDAFEPVSLGASKSVLDLFTTADHNNALPNVSAEQYVLTWGGPGANTPTAPPPAPANPLYMPTASSPTKKGAAPNMTYALAASGTATPRTIKLHPTLPTKIDYVGCVVQVLTGAARGLIAPVDQMSVSTGADPKSITLEVGGAAGLPGIAENDVIRILNTVDDLPADQGLININTAPWYVLERLPMVLNNDGTVNRALNTQLAKDIVQYRDGNPFNQTPGPVGQYARTAHGPFKSITDLNQFLSPPGGGAVTAEFQNACGTIDAKANTSTYSPGGGDLSPTPVPGGPGASSVPGDFEGRYLMVSRIANMITTKSDAFVVYVVLQGWRDAGTPSARLVTQRRAALIVDRSTANSKSPTLTTVKVPVN